jgi:putative holliday junction resolvase
MYRILAIDYGIKRTGIAITDPYQIISTGVETVYTENIMKCLKHYIKHENIKLLVIGETTKYYLETKIKILINKLKKEFPNIVIKRIDERLTSKISINTIQEAKLKKKYRKKKLIIDKISATIILQSYLEKTKL